MHLHAAGRDVFGVLLESKQDQAGVDLILQAKKLEATLFAQRSTARHASYASMASQTNGELNGSSTEATLQHHDPMKAFDWPKEEEKVLELWRELDAFKESLRQSEGRKPYTFYDGPVRRSALCISRASADCIAPCYDHLLFQPFATVSAIRSRAA